MNKSLFNFVNPQIKNESKKDEHVLTLSGVVMNESFWHDEVISASVIKESLKNVEKPIRILLNTPGGDVFEGVDIYNYLKHLDNHVTVEITSLAASAGSIICMGADEVLMRTGSNMMIHEASTFAYGTKTEIKKTLNALESIDTSLLDIYSEKTGLDKSEIETMLIEETWMTADEAVKNGFADKKVTRKVENPKGGDKKVKNSDDFMKYVARYFSNEDEPEKTLEDRVEELEKRVTSLEEKVHNEDDDDPEKTLEERISKLEDRVASLEENNEKEKPPESPENKTKKFYL